MKFIFGVNILTGAKTNAWNFIHITNRDRCRSYFHRDFNIIKTVVEFYISQLKLKLKNKLS